jgi:hypothetical protein
LKDKEHQLQRACVTWFDLQFPKLRTLLFAIPNGGHRHIATAGKLKAEGVRAGVADMFLAIGGPGYLGTFIEMKTDTGKLSDSQKAFRDAVVSAGYRYMVIRSFYSFQEQVTEAIDNQSNIKQL